MRALILCLLFSCTLFTISAKKSITVDYYGQQIQLDYDPGMVFQWRVCAKDRCVKEFYKTLNQSGAYQVLLNDLLQQKEKLELNDWMYYVLVRKTVEKLYGKIKTDKEQMPETTAAWFMLVKSGYKVDLGNAALKHLFILAPSKKKLYGIAKSSMKKGWYAYNITSHYLRIDAKLAALSMNEFDPKEGDKQFMDLSFQRHPNLNNPTVNLDIPIKHKDTTYQVTVEIDTMIRQYMLNHPKMAQEAYMELPLSEPLANSLLPQFQKILAGKSQEEALSILLSFTRRSFKYKWDWDVYDTDHSMIADRVFLEPYSDHEDKSALFCFLIRELYGYKIAVISHFNFDITIGVALEEPIGTPYMIDGVAYTICDPTSPTNSGKVGHYPNGFTDKTAKLLSILDPQSPSYPIARVVEQPEVDERVQTVQTPTENIQVDPLIDEGLYEDSPMMDPKAFHPELNNTTQTSLQHVKLIQGTSTLTELEKKEIPYK